MIARHPKTGAPIRIIKSESSAWRSKKTLVWLSTEDPDPIWNRYDVAVTSSAYADTHKANIVVCLGDPAVESAWLATSPKHVQLIAVPRALAMSIGVNAIMSYKLSNLLCLEEIGQLYPYVKPWNSTPDDAKRIIGELMHYKNNITAPYDRPPALIYVTQTYKTTVARQVELKLCLEKNLGCPMIDRIVLLNEAAGLTYGIKHPKIQERVVGKRLGYADVLRWIYEEAPANSIVVFANADIYLDDSWRALWSIDTTDLAFALLRWDMKEGKPVIFGPRADSQDTWMVDANSVKKRTWDWAAVDFPFGQGGCDNAIALELFKQKFLVVNPALTLKTYHVHETALRTYDPRNIVDKPAYLYVQPTGIHDMKPVFDLQKDVELSLAPFDRRIKGPLLATQAKTYAVMTSKVTGLTLDVDTENAYEPKVALSKYKGVFQTREGLIFTKDSTLIGPSKASKTLWSKVPVSTLSAAISVKSALVAPLPNETASAPDQYLLNYLGKILLMRKQNPAGEFWASKAVMDALKLFDWGPSLPVMSRDTTRQAWCSEALVWPLLDDQRVTKEEVAALRASIRIQRPRENRLVVVGSDWITSEIMEILEEDYDVSVLWSTTAPDVIADALVGASAFLTHGPLGNWAWLLPAGATVFEIQCEMTPSIDLLHLCGAASLDHQLYIVPKGKPTAKQLTDMTAAFKKVIASACQPVKEVSVIPTLYMPNRQGFFAHAGDSFREMAAMWAERGYVKIAPTESGHIKLGSTVLYDRPTFAWMDAEPVTGPVLLGNPEPRSPNQRPWTFWARRPRLVEELAALDLPRTKGLVFYGRSENAVQRSHRMAADWASVCDEFVHVDGEKPYPFSHEEYLRNLAQAKWGLCLAGFGKKCHREIECMAMGCVPIVGPEVDMDNYADPPVVNIHYLRAATPADVVKPEAEWEKMSAACRDWWRRNASVEGSWSLTQLLISK
jgi:hypothetical protein